MHSRLKRDGFYAKFIIFQEKERKIGKRVVWSISIQTVKTVVIPMAMNVCKVSQGFEKTPKHKNNVGIRSKNITFIISSSIIITCHSFLILKQQEEFSLT